MTGALDGITVVALEQAVAVPFATRQLADLGARVVKIERPGTGDFARHYDTTVHGQSSYFVWLNRGKESVALDLTVAADLDLLVELVAAADVFVQNLRPGAAARLGLGAAALRERHPRLITCDVSGYGPGGPYAEKKAYDLLVQCEAGVLSVTGTADEPAKVGISVADIAAGMYAYTGILTALYERERTGLGTAVEVSMLEALAEWMTQPLLFAAYGGTPPRRAGARHASISPYGPYTAGDGKAVFIGVQNDREWAVLCARLLGAPGLAARFPTNPDRVAHDDELTGLIEAGLAGFTADQAAARLDEIGIANARLRTAAELAEHPQLAARDRWRAVPTPGGPVRALLPPVTVAGRPVELGPVPALGSHTAEVRDGHG
ncbi:MAG TPA: CaiB/BaiF CoA-transferase family protein [Mycobacteriales bacterium]|nr:CaiB/BaiF CoA-transferase family protein [Mycobacteriales bacterium]